MAGEVHVVREGETLDRIAHAHGIPSGRRLYEHPANAELRERRPDPRFLVPGDEVVIPPDVDRSHRCKTNRRYVFQRIPEPEVRLRVELADGTILEGLPYELEIDGAVQQGTIPEGGVIRHVVPLHAATGELRVTTPDGQLRAWPLEIGYLEPPQTDVGLQARLANLGHYFGPLDGAAGSVATQAAIEEFQTETKDGGLGVPAIHDHVAMRHGS